MRVIPDALIDGYEDGEPLPQSARPVRMHTKDVGAEGVLVLHHVWPPPHSAK
jgi:hypothetical protein